MRTLLTHATLIDCVEPTPQPDSAVLIGAGSLAAFLSALFVVRWSLDFIQRRGFTPFAWYRIALGGAILAVLAIG